VAGVGLLILFWTVIKVLSNIDRAFNDIWGVVKGRSAARKLADYLTLMLVGPILWIVSSSATVYVATQIERIASQVEILSRIDPLIYAGLRMTSYALIWILFTLIYILMPNTRVRFISGVLAGIAAGTVFQVVQWLYIGFQIGVAKYNAIYGSFAALPLFLLWVQTSWIIVLFGAELSFAHQKGDEFELAPDLQEISPYQRKLLALQIFQLISSRFSQRLKPLTLMALAAEEGLPLGLMHQIMATLVDSGLVARIECSETEDPVYQPALDVSQLTIAEAIAALESRGQKVPALIDSARYEALSKSIARLWEAAERSPANRPVTDV
jgi:membrane protein